VSATHDTSRVKYHVKHLSDFAKTLEDVRIFCRRERDSFPFHPIYAVTGTDDTARAVGVEGLPKPRSISEIQESTSAALTLDER
jgi:hypothetical protein